MGDELNPGGVNLLKFEEKVDFFAVFNIQ